VNKINNLQISFPNIIHPEAFFADPPSFKIGIGNVIVRGCTFSVDVELGNFNQMNSLSSLAHDVKVGSFNVFMPLTRISGLVQIGDLNMFGIGTVVLQNVKIGNHTKVSAGSYVLRNTKDGYLYAGNPAKKYDI
jgi:acetyltransferase-like isoleucine patch superfamily enzyme